MKPYCPNNSNFTFREITCAPIKKPCDKPKENCGCNDGFGFCEELINCLIPDYNHFSNNCNCDKRLPHNNDSLNNNYCCNPCCKHHKRDDFSCNIPSNFYCPNCKPQNHHCLCPKCCPPPFPCSPPCPPATKKPQQRRPIVIIFKK